MKRKLLMILSIILVFVTTIAYSVLSTTLTITTEARIRPLADIRVNGIALSSTSGGATVQYESDYNKNTITSGFVLPNSGSSISYTVHVDNTGDVDYSIYDILTTSSNNQGLTYTISGYNKKDIIQAKTSLDFVITYTTTQPGEGTINVVNTLVFKKVFHITYDTQGGGTIASQIKYEDVDLTLTSTEPSKAGHYFTKWNTKQDGTGVNYLPGATYTPNEDKILYAQYIADTHTVTYDTTENGGTGTIASITVNVGDAITLPTTGASKSGWTFVGWNTDKDATSVLSSLNMGLNDVTLYAIYRKEAITRTAIWNANGSTLSSSDSTSCTIPAVYNKATQDTTCDIEPPTVTPASGFSHIGWNTSSSSITNNTKYDISTNKLNMTENGTWYAITKSTEAGSYVASFEIRDPNAVQESSVSSLDCYRYNGSSDCKVVAPIITANSGYIISGWSTSSTSTSTNYSVGTTITLTADQTFYSNTYDTLAILFDINDEYASMSCIKPSQSSLFCSHSNTTKSCYRYNGAASCSLSSPYSATANTGYSFVGYNADPTATTSQWSSNSSKTVDSSTPSTYYAITKANTYTIKYNANCPSGSTASGTMSNQSMTYDVAANLTTNAFQCLGFTFDSWNSASNGTGTSYSDGQSVSNLTASNNSTFNIYAQWTINSGTVAYNTTENGGSGSIAPVTVAFGEQITLPTTGASKSGWTFVGWNTDKDATTALSSLTMGTDGVILYAIYRKEAITRTATWYANNSTISSTDPSSCVIPEVYNKETQASYCEIEAPTVTPPSGYSFIGWNTSSGSITNNSYYDAATNKYKMHSNYSLYVVTKSDEPGPYTASFNIRHAAAVNQSSVPSEACYYYNGGTACRAIAPTLTAKSGYSFQGWSTSSSSTTTDYPGGADVSLTSNITLYSNTRASGYVYVRFYKNTATCVKLTSSSTCSTSSYQTVYGYKWNGASYAYIYSPYSVTTSTGYHLVGWNTSSSATTSTWSGNTSKSFSTPSSGSRSYSYYAITAINTYKIQFNSNCPSTPSGSMSNQSMTYGTSANLTTNAYTCDGYNFDGWNTKADGTGTSYSDGQSVNNLTTTHNATVTLYAKWVYSIWAENIGYSNSNTGLKDINGNNCLDAQCAMDALDRLLFSRNR